MAPSSPQTLKLWDTGTGHCVRTMKGHLAGVNALAVMGDGRVVSGGLDRCAWAGPLALFVPPQLSRRCSFHETAPAAPRRTLRTWDISAGVCERLLEGHQMWITSVLPLRECIVGSTSRDG